MKFGLRYDPESYSLDHPVEIEHDFSYHGEEYYATDLLKVKLWPESVSSDYLLYCYIPKLIEETFFILNGNLYIPLFYISDEPIVLKTKSISIYSLFQPISLYFKDNRVTFMQDNYELSDFIQLITHDWNNKDIALISQHVKLNSKNNKKIYTLFGKKFNCDPDPVKIKFKMNQLIFDNWTYELYEKYYGITPSIDMIIKIAFDRLIDDKPNDFTDLSYKRLTLIEPLMRVLFKRFSSTAKMLINGKSIRSLMFPSNGLGDSFFSILEGQTFYDTVNGFSSIISHKGSFKNPGAKSKLPRSVSELHPTHKCRICTNTISSTKPGPMISLVPDQDIDSRFGIFEKNHYEMKYFTME